jgi:multicomponent Na+:H+ antiporter subunit E
MIARVWLSRFIALALLWCVLTNGERASWAIGLPTVLLASVVAVRLRATAAVPVSLWALPGFLGYFLRESLRAGFGVAVLALTPGRGIAPTRFTYRSSLPGGWPRALLANTVSLMPGSLTASMAGENLSVHALNGAVDTRAAVADCERRIARLLRDGSSSGRDAAHV